MRYNGLHLLIGMALQKVEAPLFLQYADALTLGAIREDIRYDRRQRKLVEHWSLTHFSGRWLGGGFIPGLTRSAPAQAQCYFDAALAAWPHVGGASAPPFSGPGSDAAHSCSGASGTGHAKTSASGMPAAGIARAMVLLGQASHLLIDMACPVHASRVAHWSDGYEWYVDSHVAELGTLPFALPAPFANVRANVAALARFTQQFAPDRTHHHWGRWLMRRGWRQSLPQAELAAQAHAIIPVAAGHLAAMYQQFIQSCRVDACPAAPTLPAGEQLTHVQA